MSEMVAIDWIGKSLEIVAQNASRTVSHVFSKTLAAALGFFSQPVRSSYRQHLS
jgi:hypothetical protein